jgi:hypothetical protein
LCVLCALLLTVLPRDLKARDVAEPRVA